MTKLRAGDHLAHVRDTWPDFKLGACIRDAFRERERERGSFPLLRATVERLLRPTIGDWGGLVA